VFQVFLTFQTFLFQVFHLDVVKVDLDVAYIFQCFWRFRLMFQVFYLNVAKVDLGCCICCNGNIRKLQAYVSIISCVLDICFKCFILMFRKLIRCCTCCKGYTRMFQAFHLSLDVCCICFIWIF
jgi:hypothetical protein